MKESKNSIICPFCNHKHNEWWEYTDFEKDDQNFDLECEGCGELFPVSVKVERTFYSYKYK